MRAQESNEKNINQLSLHSPLYIFLASGPMIETMMHWKALTAFGDNELASTICNCLNFQQGLKRDEIPRPKLISTKDITGKTKIHNEASIKDVQFLSRQVCQGKSDIVYRQIIYSVQDIGRQVSPKMAKKKSDVLYGRSLSSICIAS